MALPNQSADPNDAFCIAATDVLQLERAGVSLCGFYHSHPRGNAQPSERDLAFAVPGFVYMIVARDGALRAWRLRDARDGFDEIRIDRDDD